tara:strand:+ start:82 stop:369 length:288 start_codon:yes stop_codon:yes gene_type:complete
MQGDPKYVHAIIARTTERQLEQGRIEARLKRKEIEVCMIFHIDIYDDVSQRNLMTQVKEDAMSMLHHEPFCCFDLLAKVDKDDQTLLGSSSAIRI